MWFLLRLLEAMAEQLDIPLPEISRGVPAFMDTLRVSVGCQGMDHGSEEEDISNIIARQVSRHIHGP